MSQNSMFGPSRMHLPARSAVQPRSSSRSAIWLSLALLCGVAAALGCKPKIGDDCTDSTECSQSGDRVCDSTQPGGYCTVFNCEPGSCPKEATCVAFRSFISAVPSADGRGWICSESLDSRFERTFCMLRCKSASDCRSGYSCVDLGEPGNAYGAEVLDQRGSKVCTVAFTPDCDSDADCRSNQVLPDAGEAGGAGTSVPASGTRFVCVGRDGEGRCWPETLVSYESGAAETVCTGSSGGTGASGGAGGTSSAAGSGGASGSAGRAGGGSAGIAAGGGSSAEAGRGSAGSAGLSAGGGGGGGGALAGGGSGGALAGGAAGGPVAAGGGGGTAGTLGTAGVPVTAGASTAP